MNNTLRNVILTAMILAFVVIVLGAYVRLTDAGLGCPDWPGCYGILLGVPTTDVDIALANTDYERAVEVGKAWREMIHRYFAGILGCLILVIAVFLMRKDSNGVPCILWYYVGFTTLVSSCIRYVDSNATVKTPHRYGSFTRWIHTI